MREVALVLRILLGELTPEQACAEERLTNEELTEWMRCHRRAARRVIEDRFAAALAAQGLDSEDFVMSGNLESMVLSDLLEAIRLGRKNARIRIEHDGEHSHLWCAEGELIDAQAGLLVGDAAVYRLLALGHGRLQADFSSVSRERTVLASTESLLVDFARRLDEGRLLRERIGDTERIVVPDPRAHVALAGLDPEERCVLHAFDGTRSIEAVIQASQRPELETLAAIFRLLGERRLIPAAELGSALTVIAPGSEPSPLGPPEPRPASHFSVPPIAASSAAALARSRVLGFTPLTAALAAALGAVLPLVFAAGFWSARRSPQPAAAPPAAEPALTQLVDTLCGPGMALFAAGAPPPGGALEAAPRPFCLSQRPVSTGEYEACVRSGRCEPAQAETETAGAEGEGGSLPVVCNSGQSGRDEMPINCVTHGQAERYCASRGQRLPSPGEWESAWQTTRAGAGWRKGAAPAGAQQAASVLGELSEWTKGHLARTPPGLEPSAERQLYAVLGTASSTGAGEAARPSRLYMSASAHGRNVGFRCASSLQASAEPPRVETSPASAP